MANTTRTYGTREDRINWSAAVWAGVIAGAVFLILEMIMVPLFLGGSPWAPPRMIAATVMGQGVLPPPATFGLGIFIVAMIVHFVLSILYAIILAFIVFRMTTGPALLVGAVFGLLLYLVNFFLLTGIFPWFANARNWVSVFAHIAFGLAAAWSYKALANPTRRT